MKIIVTLSLFFFLFSCSHNDTKNQKPLTDEKTLESNWLNYEGRWASGSNILILELSLKEGSPGVDSEYKLHELSYSEKRAAGALSHDKYSTISGLSNNGFGIQLHNLEARSEIVTFRFDNPSDVSEKEEMFFITRGNDELLPCDNHFKPLTLDSRYSLHKRSRLFTVEGYFSIENDTCRFFERNTMENWKVANLGEIDSLKARYKSLAKEKYEGIYLKALAYSVADSAKDGQTNSLVIKRILTARKSKGISE